MASNSEQDKSERKESWAIKYKRWRLRSGYSWGVFKRRINLAYILFFIAIFLFGLIMVPNAAHRLPLPSEKFPYVFDLHGSIEYVQNASDPTSFQSARNAKLEVGGYTTFTDAQGQFSLRFVSLSRDDIPVIITWNNRNSIERLAFDQGQFEKTVLFQIGA